MVVVMGIVMLAMGNGADGSGSDGGSGSNHMGGVVATL
jgi:hypothetical protein